MCSFNMHELYLTVMTCVSTFFNYASYILTHTHTHTQHTHTHTQHTHTHTQMSLHHWFLVYPRTDCYSWSYPTQDQLRNDTYINNYCKVMLYFMFVCTWSTLYSTLMHTDTVNTLDDNINVGYTKSIIYVMNSWLHL